MTGTSHLIFGIGSGIAASLVSPSLFFANIPLVGIFSLLPDIDSPTSRLGRNFKMISKVFGHRGFFHTPLFLSLSFLIWDRAIRWSFLLGVASHIFLDLMNKGGIMLLWPLSKKKYRIADLKCGAWVESAIVISLLGLEIALALLYKRYFST